MWVDFVKDTRLGRNQQAVSSINYLPSREDTYLNCHSACRLSTMLRGQEATTMPYHLRLPLRMRVLHLKCRRVSLGSPTRNQATSCTVCPDRLEALPHMSNRQARAPRATVSHNRGSQRCQLQSSDSTSTYRQIGIRSPPWLYAG